VSRGQGHGLAMVTNADVAGALYEIADLLDLLGERFKPEAYRRAARAIESLSESVEAISGRGELRTIPGVGEAIEGKVSELVAGGSLPYLEKLRLQVPAGVLALMRLSGVGPKTARRLWSELGIDSPAALATAIDAGRLSGVRGFAERKLAQLRAAAGTAESTPTQSRVRIEEALPLARSIVEALRAAPTVHDVALAGSLRRARETVGDLDVLVTADDAEGVFDRFSRLAQVREVRLRGPTKETVVLRTGLQVDLRVVEPEAFGAALQYFTGSKDHNVRVRSLARERGLKVNEYGVFRGDDRIAGRTEEEVYAAVGLPWIPPELREDRGEIAAAAAGTLPSLVEQGDLVSDLHVHLPEDARAAEIDPLISAARERAIPTVGVVVGRVEAGAPRRTLGGPALARLRELAGGVRFVPVVEVDGAWPERADALAPLGAAYAIVIPTAGPQEDRPPAVPSLPVRLLAHLDPALGQDDSLLPIAERYGAAVEVGPGPGRLDSTGARRAREHGVRLALPTGLGLGPEDPTAEVALGFARRAAARPEEVLNARGPLEVPVLEEASSGKGRPTARPKR